MGSKNPEAVAVCGTRLVSFADPERTRALIKQFQKEIHQTALRNNFRLGLGPEPGIPTAAANRCGETSYDETSCARDVYGGMELWARLAPS